MEKRDKLELVIEQLEERIAPGVVTKGNNGWGNGADSTNSGSFSGGTDPSKSINSSDGFSDNPNNGTPKSDGR
jgi:hypothetical protein